MQLDTNRDRLPRILRILGILMAMALTAAACGSSAGAGDIEESSTATTEVRPRPRPSGSQGGPAADSGGDGSAQTDSGPSGEADGPTGSSDSRYLATILIGTDSVSGEPAGCNSDRVLGDATFDLYLEGDRTITGVEVDSGSSVEALSRCEGSSYGGLRDVGDTLFEVGGEMTSEGVHLVIESVDQFEWYFDSGNGYGTTSLFEAVLPYAEAVTEGVTGTAAEFTIEADTLAAMTDKVEGARFEGSDPHDDGAWWDSNVTVWFYSEKKVSR